jgi:hypothetical protein
MWRRIEGKLMSSIAAKSTPRAGQSQALRGLSEESRGNALAALLRHAADIDKPGA